MDDWDTCHGCDNYVIECTCGEDDICEECDGECICDEPDIMDKMYVF